jgi:type V secretory pathway adhesin AidA
MKSLFALASVLIFSAAPAFAGEGQVSHQSLSNMGLTGMKAMTDAQGMQVRGLSVAVAGGHSTANVNLGFGNNASSSNFYFAAGKHSASGANLSAATIVSIDVDGHYVSSNTTIIAAGGFSTAKAH